MKRIFSLLLALVMVLGLAALFPPAQAKTGGKLVALTFDDGPGPYTSRLLDGLKERGIEVTFFMVGSSVSRYPELVKRMYQEGHQLANHSYDHPDFTGLSDSEIRSQISRTNALLDKAAGAGSTYMVRAPYGSTNSRVRSVVGAPLTYWSVDPQDWKDRNATTVKNRVVSNAHDGAIILLHDIHSTSVDGALAAIDVLLDEGYEFVTVREMFRRRGVALENGVSYTRCSPTGVDYGPVAEPVISSASVNGKLQITITAQEGTSIYYSLENGTLNQESKRYTGPFTVEAPCTVWAVAAYNMNGDRSKTVSKTFSKMACEPPAIQVTEEGILNLTRVTPGTDLFYTLDGTAATENSTQYTGMVPIEPGTEICACAGGASFFTSATARATYSHLGNFFRDVYMDQWYYPYVDQAVHEGYMLGTGFYEFAPTKPLTRGQLITLLYRYSGETVTQEELDACPFQDLEKDRFYVEAVCWAYAKGIVIGYDETTFGPDNSVKRQEMCKIFGEFLSYRGKLLPEGTGSAEQYTDAAQIPQWAIPYVESMTACGLILGDKEGTFRPGATAIRAQAATLLVRLSELEDTLPDAPTEPVPVEPEPTQPEEPAPVEPEPSEP